MRYRRSKSSAEPGSYGSGLASGRVDTNGYNGEGYSALCFYLPAGWTRTVIEMCSAIRGSQGTSRGEIWISAVLPGTARSSDLRASAGLKPRIPARRVLVDSVGAT